MSVFTLVMDGEIVVSFASSFMKNFRKASDTKDVIILSPTAFENMKPSNSLEYYTRVKPIDYVKLYITINPGMSYVHTIIDYKYYLINMLCNHYAIFSTPWDIHSLIFTRTELKWIHAASSDYGINLIQEFIIQFIWLMIDKCYVNIDTLFRRAYKSMDIDVICLLKQKYNDKFDKMLKYSETFPSDHCQIGPPQARDQLDDLQLKYMEYYSINNQEKFIRTLLQISIKWDENFAKDMDIVNNPLELPRYLMLQRLNYPYF